MQGFGQQREPPVVIQRLVRLVSLRLGVFADGRAKQTVALPQGSRRRRPPYQRIPLKNGFPHVQLGTGGGRGNFRHRRHRQKTANSPRFFSPRLLMMSVSILALSVILADPCAWALPKVFLTPAKKTPFALLFSLTGGGFVVADGEGVLSMTTALEMGAEGGFSTGGKWSAL